MKRQFADDPMMSELHAIREKHYQQTKSAPAKEDNGLYCSPLDTPKGLGRGYYFHSAIPRSIMWPQDSGVLSL